MRYKLISSVQVNVGEFTPLHLPIPTMTNSGGYLTPSFIQEGATDYNYSSIDLLIAALEAYYLGEIVTNLAQFFDSNRIMMSDNWVNLTIKDSETGQITNGTVNTFKIEIMRRNNLELLRVFKKNAPLSRRCHFYARFSS